MSPRYFVSVWHGEGGSIAEVRDHQEPDDCLGMYSTTRDGAAWRDLADRHAARLEAERG